MERSLDERKSCGICDKTFSRPSNCYKHIRVIHGVEPKTHKKCSLVCPSCFRLFVSYSDFREYLITVHKIELYKEEMLFENYRLPGMEGIKREGNKLFTCENYWQQNKNKKSYYVCHRLKKTSRYTSISESNRQKHLKCQGSAKLNVTCPSTVELISKDNKFRANLFTPHIGHKCILTHIYLTKTERKQIAGKIAEGVSFQKILDGIRDAIDSSEYLGRLNLLDRQDLRNITRVFLYENIFDNLLIFPAVLRGEKATPRTCFTCNCFPYTCTAILKCDLVSMIHSKQ